jgi:hypothetical protein
MSFLLNFSPALFGREREGFWFVGGFLIVGFFYFVSLLSFACCGFCLVFHFI